MSSYRLMVVVQDDGDDGSWKIIDYETIVEMQGSETRCPETMYKLCKALAQSAKSILHAVR